MEKKKKGSYTYEFQEFITINQIDVKKLPKFLRKMIKQINKLERKAKEDCTAAHYRIVVKQMRPFANEVIDELYEIFQNKLKNNTIKEVEEETTPLREDEAILEWMKKEERFYITTAELAELGVHVIFPNRVIEVGKLELRRGLGQDHWRITAQTANPTNDEEKGGKDD